LTIETHVGDEGRVIDYQVLSGPAKCGSQWLDQASPIVGRIRPATAFGKPVESRMILSFVAVRN
jgi:hypothetical protein